MAIVADLGIDRLVSYRIGPDGSLTRLAESTLAPGAGPRHVALHPGGRFVFLMNELDSTVVSLALDNASARLTVIDAKPAVPAEARDGNHCADIQISPDGRFLYSSNRGHDSVAVFSVDQQTGTLALVDYTPCGGATPRNLALTPSGGHGGLPVEPVGRDHAFAPGEHFGVGIDVGAVRRHRQEGRIVDVTRLSQFPRLQRLFVETVDAQPDAARALKIRRLAVGAADEDQTGVCVKSSLVPPALADAVPNKISPVHACKITPYVKILFTKEDWWKGSIMQFAGQQCARTNDPCFPRMLP